MKKILSYLVVIMNIMTVVTFLDVDWHFDGDWVGPLDGDMYGVRLLDRVRLRDRHGNLHRYLHRVWYSLFNGIRYRAIDVNGVGLDDVDRDRPVDRDGHGHLHGDGDVLDDGHGVRLGDAHGHFFVDGDALDLGLPDDGAVSVALAVTEAGTQP